MFALINPNLLVIGSVSMAISFLSGYAYHAHRAQVDQAGQEATVQTVTKTITVTDKAAVSRLQSQLAAAHDKASALETLINEARNATSIPAADCRLPERVRDAINADLAEGAR